MCMCVPQRSYLCANVYNFFVFCFIEIILRVRWVVIPDVFAHVRKDISTGSGEILRLNRCQWHNVDKAQNARTIFSVAHLHTHTYHIYVYIIYISRGFVLSRKFPILTQQNCCMERLLCLTHVCSGWYKYDDIVSIVTFHNVTYSLNFSFLKRWHLSVMPVAVLDLIQDIFV